MNSQLIIIGNGFDLHCGLKSSYEDFFRQSILDVYSAKCGFPKMKQDCNGFWENLLIEHYRKRIDIENNWCAVETIIKETLLNVVFGTTSTNGTTYGGIWRKALNYSWYKIDNLTETSTIDPIKKFLFLYCVKYFDEQKKHEKTNSEREQLRLLIEHLLQELHNFERRFCKYLKDNIINPRNNEDLNTKYIVNAVNLIGNITGSLKENYTNIESFICQESKEFSEIISPSQTSIKTRQINVLSKEFSKLKHSHILSFNYTNVFDILEVESPCLYSNVHGKLCSAKCAENCYLSNIIFGIDDKIIQSYSENTELRLFSKTYRKMLADKNPASILPRNDGTYIAIKFYGHSLSEADYSYFQSIFDYYNLYSNNNVSLFFYYTEGYEQTDSIYRLINVYGKSLSNKEQGKNLMHKLLLENRLNIVKIS